MPETTRTIKLEYPITLSDGRVLAELTMRRTKVKDQVALEGLFSEVEGRLVAELAGLKAYLSGRGAEGLIKRLSENQGEEAVGLTLLLGLVNQVAASGLGRLEKFLDSKTVTAREVEPALFARLTDQPLEVIEELDTDDYDQVQKVFTDFF
ncbi:MAG: phage tail assembly protein, partial [Thermodesulfobacteriota bacterium]